MVAVMKALSFGARNRGRSAMGGGNGSMGKRHE